MLKISGLYFLSHHLHTVWLRNDVPGEKPRLQWCPGNALLGQMVFWIYCLWKLILFRPAYLNQRFFYAPWFHKIFLHIFRLLIWVFDVNRRFFFLRTSSKIKCSIVIVMLWVLSFEDSARLANEMMALLKIQVKFLNHICKNFVNIVDDNEFKRFD